MKGESPSLHAGIGSSYRDGLEKAGERAGQGRVCEMIPGLAGRTAGSALFQKSNCGPVSAEEKLVWSTCCLPGGPLGTAGAVSDSPLQ